MPKSSDYVSEINNFLGAKIHQERLSRGWSRQQLAVKIDITHQQLQKYENGSNRISVGRLAAIAKAFGKTISYFFNESESVLIPNQHERMCLEVSRNFTKIQDPNMQYAINLLIRTAGNA